MFYRYRDRVNRWQFNHKASAILETDAVVSTPGAEAAVLSQLQHKDLLMFLVALKSFALKIPLNKVYVLNDGSLTEEDRRLLARHIEPVEFMELSQIDTLQCPNGGCWERLLAIAEKCQESYIVQLDSDTVTLDAIDEVADLIGQNRSFAIGTWDNQTIEPMAICSERVRKNVNPSPDAHVQMVTEAAFLDLEDCNQLNYVRGCAGFSGFGQGTLTAESISTLSTRIEALVGEKWHEWGSEQVMSNLMVANSPNASVLPHPQYCDCSKIDKEKTRFIHFVGSCRFAGGQYGQQALKIIDLLKSGTRS